MQTKNPLINAKPYLNQTALVIGLARSGIAAAALIHAAGGRVLLYDRKSRDELGDLSELDKLEHASWHLAEEIAPLYQKADFAIISPGIPPDAPDIRGAVLSGLPLHGELEFASAFAPCPMYAVTGTNGKTTTVSLLGDMMEKGGYLTHVAGNIGYPLSAAVLDASPDDRIVVEVSSFQLETTQAFHPKAAAILNITPDHLDRHGSMDNYIALKKKIFANLQAEDTLVLNANYANCAKMGENCSAQLLWFSAVSELDSGAFLRDEQIVIRIHGEERMVCPAQEVRIPGRHNLENALAASAMAAAADIPAPVIRHSLRTFAGVEHRMEYVRQVDQVWYINDSKGTNPDSTQRAVEAMSVPTVLILGGRDKHIPYDALADTIKSSAFIQHIVLIGEAADIIREALNKHAVVGMTRAQSLEDAVLQGKEHAVPGGAVLLSPACASFDMFKDYEERGRCFKAIVQSL